jgi:hypothetical protein
MVCSLPLAMSRREGTGSKKADCETHNQPGQDRFVMDTDFLRGPQTSRYITKATVMSEQEPTEQVGGISNDKALHHEAGGDLEGIIKKSVLIYLDYPGKVINQSKAADEALIDFEAGGPDQFKTCHRLRRLEQTTPC